jgi:hypothetical protein
MMDRGLLTVHSRAPRRRPQARRTCVRGDLSHPTHLSRAVHIRSTRRPHGGPQVAGDLGEPFRRQFDENPCAACGSRDRTCLTPQQLAGPEGRGDPGGRRREMVRWTVRRPALHPQAACRVGDVDDETSGEHGPGRAERSVRASRWLRPLDGPGRRASSRVVVRPACRARDRSDADARPLQLILGGASSCCGGSAAAGTAARHLSTRCRGSSPARHAAPLPYIRNMAAFCCSAAAYC